MYKRQSPFLGRLDDINVRGTDLIAEIAEIFQVAGDIDTQIIAASIRNPIHVTDCAPVSYTHLDVYKRQVRVHGGHYQRQNQEGAPCRMCGQIKVGQPQF